MGNTGSKGPDLKLIDGKVVTAAEEAVRHANVVMIGDDVTLVQTMTRRLLKAMGSKVKTRVTLSALACCIGKVFTVIPKAQHGPALAEFQNLVLLSVLNEYTPQEREEARLRALAAQRAVFEGLKHEEQAIAEGREPPQN